MICEKCNKNIDDDSKFCSFCGNKIEKKVEEVYIDKLKQNISDEIELSKNEELKDSGEDEKNLKSMGFYDFYFNYKGSIGRKEFFFRGFLPLTIIELLLSISIFITVNLSVYNSFYNILKYLLITFFIIVFIIISNIIIKRLNDMNTKPWFFIFNLIPFVNVILLLSLLSTPSSKIRNHGQKSYYKLCILRITIAILQIILILMLMFVYSYLEKNSKTIFYKNVNIHNLELSGVEKDVHDLTNLPSQKINESTTFLNATINKKSINLRYMADGINSYDMTYVERENFSSILQDKFCAEHTFKNILDYNYEIVVTYIDNNFQIISEVLLDKYNCK